MYSSHLDDFIKQFYIKMDILKPKQINFFKIADCLDIKIHYWDESSQAAFLKNSNFIFLNEHLSFQQQWQDFCHELAHVLFHTGHQGRMAHTWIEYQENKANNFMYHACIPSFMLDELNLYYNNSITAIQIQELFNVEYDFAVKRLTQYISNKRVYAELAYRKSLQEL
ncbi:ImmA/IrrE family metallo-endopeptidase [Lysinibacillus sp. FSL M8-0337]|uniref:ImmA/IrrE family metallo-endopeptidase n=1 Tax=Lysinibacillus TaxID=400634 RepID=UPI00084A3B86|nr:ImmA/IrrE family metallo-endopeptidase [Lysinibacillus sphaericus]